MKTDVTIFCLTYNHAAFIKDSLDSFLAQKTVYKYNIFIYDDASTDGTSDILMEYKKLYPDIFDIYISDRNIFNEPDRDAIFRKLYREHIVGSYVAWCEGDDYWIDESKLQKQVEYMETHPDCSMTAHGSHVIDYSLNEERDYHPYECDRILTEGEIILQRHGNLPTASLVMRREVIIRDDEYPACDVGDIPIQLSALLKGYIYYFDSIMSVYRYMHDGSWSSEFHGSIVATWVHKLNMAVFLKEYDNYTSNRFHKFVREKMLECLYLPLNYSGKLDIAEMQQVADKVNKKTCDVYKKYVECQMELFNIINNENYVLHIKESIKGKKHIVVFGTGVFAHKLLALLNNDNISIDGFVVSDSKSILDGEKNRIVWKIKDYPYSWKDTYLIIAVSHKYQLEIENILVQNEINEYIAPYWLDM